MHQTALKMQTFVFLVLPWHHWQGHWDMSIPPTLIVRWMGGCYNSRKTASFHYLFNPTISNHLTVGVNIEFTRLLWPCKFLPLNHFTKNQRMKTKLTARCYISRCLLTYGKFVKNQGTTGSGESHFEVISLSSYHCASTTNIRLSGWQSTQISHQVAWF
jgi:hypothetical protein